MKMLSYINLHTRICNIHVTFVVNKAIIQNSVREILNPIGTCHNGSLTAYQYLFPFNGKSTSAKTMFNKQLIDQNTNFNDNIP